MSGCEPTDEVRRIIRAMARAKVEEGYTSHEAILDEIHEAIKDHTPLWKNEIADIITGIGQPKRQATKSELQQRMEQLRKDLKDAYHPKVKPLPKSPEEAANKRRQDAIRKQIADIQQKVKTGDFSKATPPNLPDDQATQKLRLDLAAAKREADKALAAIQRAGRTPSQKVLETAGALYRNAILSGYTVFEHLTGASIGRFVTAPLEDLVGQGLSHLPGLREIARRAPIEGRTANAQALKEGYLKIFSGETGKAMKDKLVRGYSDRQALYDKHVDYGGHWLSLLGHLHDTIKTPVEQFAFHKALASVNQHMRNELAREGKSPDEIDAHMANEYTQSRNATYAYAYSKAAKLQGDNWLVDMVQGAIRQLQTKGPVGKAAAGVAKLTMPILRIPTNFAKETAEYATGVPQAAMELIYKSIVHGQEKISPQDADDIMRKFKKGAVGAALISLGWLLYKDLGALYDEKRRKKAGEPDYGDVRTPAGTISHHMLHIPAVEVMQMAALAHRIFDQQNGKLDKKTGERTGPISAGITAAWRPAMALGKTLPFVPDEITRVQDAKSAGDYAGKLVSGFNPQLFQQIARATDPDKAPRSPKGFVQQIEAGVPGLRENVPHRPLKGMGLDEKLDLYDKMTPAERSKSGITESILGSARSKRATLTDDQLQRIKALQ